MKCVGTPKKVLLIDADSTIPNLALMKIHTWHKNKGNKMTLVKTNIAYYTNKKKRA